MIPRHYPLIRIDPAENRPTAIQGARQVCPALEFTSLGYTRRVTLSPDPALCPRYQPSSCQVQNNASASLGLAIVGVVSGERVPPSSQLLLRVWSNRFSCLSRAVPSSKPGGDCPHPTRGGHAGQAGGRACLEGVVVGGGDEEVARGVEAERVDGAGVRVVVLHQLVGARVPQLQHQRPHQQHRTGVEWVSTPHNASTAGPTRRGGRPHSPHSLLGAFSYGGHDVSPTWVRQP